MKPDKIKDMKTILKVLPLALFVACAPKQNGNIESLKTKRDSLQTVDLQIQKDINNLNKEIALLDTTASIDELKLIKKIAMQKNKVVAMSKKLKKLENELASYHKDKNLIPVAVKELSGEDFNHYLTVYGRVEASEYARVSPEIGGQIRTIHVKSGDWVSKGQLLVSLNTDAVKNNIKATETNLELAKTTFDRQAKLYKENIGSEIQYLSAKSTLETLEAQLEAQKAQLRMSQIRAPFDGYVDEIYQKEGALASSMAPVLVMVNLSKIQVKADVSEIYVDKIKKGQLVELGFSTLPDLKLKRPIIWTSKVIDQSSRTFEIEVQVNNPDKKIKPNMVSSIRINDYSKENALVVPSTVIRRDISGDYVYVIVEKDGEYVAEKRNIETSLSYNEETLVTKGLKKGDKVVVEGYHLISSDVPVKIVG
jgi:membrane fusion protein, multidrug efflux system